MLKKLNFKSKDTYNKDSVTQLLDRSSLINKLSEILSDSPDNADYVFGIANIEQFKLINHSYGYKAGDYVLNVVAKTLSLEMDKGTIVGRLGNDEFGFICMNNQIAQIQSSCESLNFSLSHAPVTWDNKKIRLHIKFGLVKIDETTKDIDKILNAVNEAIYSAQYDGCSTVCEYDEENTAILRRSDNMQEAITLQRWIARDQFLLYVQPIVYLDNPKKASHFELLLRGQSDNGEVISPGKLIESAEDFNLTPMLDKWVIRNLFSWVNKNNSSLSSKYKFSFNLSALSINDSDLSQYIIEMAKKENINPRKINIEVTERVAISNLKRCYDFMRELIQEGFTFSLDDFGSGYCSFKYIQTLPFDVIKIDGSFIKDIETNKQNQTITKAVTDIANAYGKKTIAEYVENKEIADIVRSLGVDYGQGYYYSKAFPISQLSKSEK
ncbi:MAG: bifunctional diguanylate cyclase/phosphodiesterase [Gammaproteobacteria bacterium]|nr:bifunctional diguanylate cyclase/phosphodiesterase [Gammaproteobacteria bacterium]